MSKRKHKIDNRQMSLLDILQQVQDEHEETESTEGRLNIAERLRLALKTAIQNSGLGRHQIAGQMSHLLGVEVTKTTIDSWTAESKEGHRIPAEYLPAFCIVTGDLTPIRIFDQIRIEREANWRYTSRKTVHNVLLGLVEVVAEAVPGTMDEYGCAMELADREKLKKAGFRIFRMDAKKRLIEEYHHGDTWVIYAECVSPKQLNDTFKQLLEDHMHLKG